MSRLLIEAGEALYGSRWQTDLAQQLGVNSRTVRRWVADHSAVPAIIGSETETRTAFETRRRESIAKKSHICVDLHCHACDNHVITTTEPSK